jgi:tetratricopeptide (TPR) repeat protein
MRATTCFGDDFLPRSKLARAVLGRLCLAAGGIVPRAGLTAMLSDQTPEASAGANLNQALGELAAVFGVFAKELISIERDQIRLNLDACWVDALAILALDRDEADLPLARLKELCSCELLSDLDGTSVAFDRWLLDERTRLLAALKLPSTREPERARAHGSTRAQFPAVGHLTLTDILRRRPKPLPKSGRDRLRVGLLSFAASGSEANENLAFALSQEIAAALGRFRWFDVVAAVSLPACAIGEHELRRMDLDYLVDWTVAENGRDTEISVRLLDLDENARPIWAKRFNLADGGLHRLNEVVATDIVGRIDPVIPFIEGQFEPHDRYGATGFLVRAAPLMFSMEREKYEQAGQLINQALKIDPDNSDVAVLAARWHHFRITQGWTKHTEQAFETVARYALRAIKLNPQNAEALGIYAHYCSFVHKDFNAAVYCFDRSLRLNPSLGLVWGLSGSTYCYIGEPGAALERLERYRELTPFDPHISWFELLYTIAYLFKKDYERAAIVGRRVVRALPKFVNAYKPFIAALGHLDRHEEAQVYVDKVRALEPNFTVERFGEVYPIKKASDRKRYMDGLRLAGIPER